MYACYLHFYFYLIPSLSQGIYKASKKLLAVPYVLIFTVCNEVVKVMFLHLCVCPQVGVCLSACWDTSLSPLHQAATPQTRQAPPRADTPWTRQAPPRPGRPPSPHRTRQVPSPWERQILLWMVHILLEFCWNAGMLLQTDLILLINLSQLVKLLLHTSVASLLFHAKCYQWNSICLSHLLIFCWCELFQINTVVKTNRDLQQWLNLGDQSQACITIPESCGNQGGTVSAWVKRGDCISQGGIISSLIQPQTSFSIYCDDSELR